MAKDGRRGERVGRSATGVAEGCDRTSRTVKSPGTAAQGHGQPKSSSPASVCCLCLINPHLRLFFPLLLRESRREEGEGGKKEGKEGRG